MRGANLYRAGLAGIDWRGADLRGANLARASFRVEGSRGVRPEDRFDRRPDRDPSEFRTASLRGADLRGARVVDADFHLVDLRGALYEESQAEHFRRSGAILE